MWILTKTNNILNVEKLDNTILPALMVASSESVFDLVRQYDIIYTWSEKKEDVGFVTKVTKNAFVVTFSKMCKRVTFYLNKDKKLRLIKEIWKPHGDNEYRKVWSE